MTTHAQTTRAQSLFVDTSDTPAGVLQLRNGSSAKGNFRSIDSGEAIAWQGESFTRPFEFLLPEIGSINFPPADPLLKMEGEFALELHNGDLLSGKLIDWSDGVIELESPRFGRVRIREQTVHRLDRIDENPAILFSGLSGLGDWKKVKGEWKAEGTELIALKPDSSLAGDFAIPDKAVVEFELTWDEDPNFSFAIGVDPAAEQINTRGWSFDSWNSQLILVRERPDVAVIEPLQKLDRDAKYVRLIVFVDQTADSILVYLPGGKLLSKAALAVEEGKKAPRERTTGIALVNHSGQTRLKRLRVARWDGSLPLTPDSIASRFRLADDRLISGQVKKFDRSSRQLTVLSPSGDVSFALGQVVMAEFAASQSASTSSLIFSLQDQTRISGELLSIDDRHLSLQVPNLLNPIQIECALVRSVAFRAPEKEQTTSSSQAKSGYLEIGGHRLTGHLDPATVTDDASCLVWHPDSSRTASPLTRTASGRIVYRERTPPSQEVPTTVTVQEIPRQRGLLEQFGQLFLGGPGKPAPPVQPKNEEPHDLHLISGDMLPCRVNRIDESGVHFNSSSAEVNLIPHEKIKALILKRSQKMSALDEDKKQRLLTLPRNQKTSPPTHLLYSDRGDFLRCRLNSLVEERLVIELHLAESAIPLSRISHIIWLHPEKLQQKTEASPGSPDDPLIAERDVESAAPPSLHEVQVILAGDNRSTFVPSEISDESVIGTSDVIGACRFQLASIDQIVFGGHIEVVVRDLPFHEWVLTPAPDPLYVQAAEGGSADDGRASAFVGKPAPDFQLELLTGEKFVLSEAQGKIIVLDFWATWCGPCMLTMPLMEDAMKSFDPEQVQLISVNLEERPEQVREVLERHNLSPKVALDRDGVVARRYQVESIPQLIVVDKDGTVARLYIGGGQNIVDQFKAALTEMLETPSEKAAEPSPVKN
ncbi:MAG TPA: TlpA disulfide reductase family protein [Planctomycetaceae bacterium]|nr:TlpA disulfide reductase family protein [Planctomycetaceae bacterium]